MVWGQAACLYLVDAVQPQIMEAIVIHVPGKTHAAAYRMHAKEA